MELVHFLGSCCKKKSHLTFLRFELDGTIKSFEGKVFGTLQFPPKGENGFGYDPIFIPKGYKKTFGEMKYSFKERISHRQKAFKKLQNFIAKL